MAEPIDPATLRTLAADFLRLPSWRERSTWRMARIRHLERIEQELRSNLEAFTEGGPAAPALADLDAIARWVDERRAELEAITALRAERG